MRTLYCGSRSLLLDRPALMGIVNLTPDSFSGDGLAGNLQAAIAHAHAQIDAGADILDLGAESSRPGAVPLSLQEELARLLPVMRALRNCSVPISVDTYKPEVMRAALDEGACIINDIFALRKPGAIELVRDAGCTVCLMHMQGVPQDMQVAPVYHNVVRQVSDFLTARVRDVLACGVERQHIWLDPGFGFGKTLVDNKTLFAGLRTLSEDGFPVLVGVSRKSMLSALCGRPSGELFAASVVAALLAAQQGAQVLRVHDVAGTLDALRIWNALKNKE